MTKGFSQKQLLLIVLTSILSLFVKPSLAQQQLGEDDANHPQRTNEQISSLFTSQGFIATPWSKQSATPSEPTPVVVKKKSFLKEKKDELIESLTSLHYKYAMMLNVNVELLKNSTLLSFIEDWWGTRYRYGGTTKKGIDCSALMDKLVDDVYGVELPRTAREQYAASQRIDKEDLQEGDLVFFRTKSYISHVGLYLENGYFVHASSSRGVMISRLDDSYFAQKYAGAGRF